MSVGSYHKQSASSGLISLRVDPQAVKGFQDFMQLVPKAVAAAQRRAINKVLRWLRTHIARDVGRQERIAIAAVRQRLKAFPVSNNGQGRLWFGINPIEASRAGRPRQTRSGVSVAGRRYEGAFFKRVYGGSPDIWIRTASKHFDAWTNRAHERLQAVMEQEMNFELQKYLRRAGNG